MPPGFATQCPYGLELPIPVTPWIFAGWVIVYAVWAELVSSWLGLLVLRLRGTASRGAAASLLLVAGCAAGALAVAEWLTHRDIQACFALPFSPHVTLPLLIQARRLYAELQTQLHIALGLLAAMFVLATALTIVTLVRGWRESRHARAAA